MTLTLSGLSSNEGCMKRHCYIMSLQMQFVHLYPDDEAKFCFPNTKDKYVNQTINSIQWPLLGNADLPVTDSV